MDSHFQVVVLNQTLNPEQVIYQAMHQDYSSHFVTPDGRIPDNHGEIIVKQLLEGNRGHYGPLEHPQISFGAGYFPHSVMQQARTHRVGISFDVQSFRYTGEKIAQLGEKLLQEKHGEVLPSETEGSLHSPLADALESLFYIPQTVIDAKAKTRQGIKSIAADALPIILEQYRQQAVAYYRLVHECGLPYEDARNVIGYGIRQHFVVSFNCRSLMHFLDLRAKDDAQLEIRQMCDLILPHFQEWCPHIAQWYVKNRWAKARLAP
ncbi:MAG: FAD-dependent thymidylate synthase [Cyanobacteriota bacterium]|nr:FAD-dependent thymidylate synthase [Cyanobacteriota bacterium]